ncbi:hypothetical protein VCRA2116O29_190037 [Vibrio crassostreae]|nr:hypothetical protein VCRA2116O29_190037 [Vibrio crassostreae]CAK2472347.1 hypothetical protein VCRA2119O48_310003 [Vibrio crassostreae]CAK3088410.1 hypothetical protein VCRA2133E348_670003 [Vibrio crassostreae]CAK3626823.1 hypothetical protein VCRA213O314_720022 [Vibrio crassostreae]CAK3656665.1 hypothetical protein VCRA2123O74_190054 [Vibrio crassostreae]
MHPFAVSQEHTLLYIQVDQLAVMALDMRKDRLSIIVELLLQRSFGHF